MSNDVHHDREKAVSMLDVIPETNLIYRECRVVYAEITLVDD